eukprot:scaffold131879_cov60-Phaeocystis_antarctica.AAC.2
MVVWRDRPSFPPHPGYWLLLWKGRLGQCAARAAGLPHPPKHGPTRARARSKEPCPERLATSRQHAKAHDNVGILAEQVERARFTEQHR